MVITNIIGGLGNQMFQYAIGRTISIQRKQPFFLDTSLFQGYPLHQGFELKKVFNIQAAIATESDIRNILTWQSSPFIQKVLKRPVFSNLKKKTLVIEPYFQYWDGIKKVPDNCYLTGYWQSEKYFMETASIIRKDFSFDADLTGQNAELVKQMKQVTGVSIHIRRGDYANNPKTLSMHGLCSEKYYRDAVKLISRQIKQPYFYIFSDDMEWVKANIKIEYPHKYVNHNQGTQSYKDMHLMSLCRHHIIANSSFSWWGAWLNPSKEKIVVAPKKWFANNTNAKDLLPQNWIKL